MIRFFKLLALTLIGIAVIAIAVANRHGVQLVIDPLSEPDVARSLEAPLFLFLFAALLTGFVLGALAAWVSQSKWRQLARQRTKEAYRLRRDQEQLAREIKAQRQSADMPARDAVPQLAGT